MVWAAALALAFSGAAQTDYTETGNGLLDSCTAADGQFRQALCLGFIDGVVQAHGTFVQMKAAPYFCIPVGATKGQIRDVVVKHLRDNPADRAYSGSSMVIVALGTAWPCKKS